MHASATSDSSSATPEDRTLTPPPASDVACGTLSASSDEAATARACRARANEIGSASEGGSCALRAAATETPLTRAVASARERASETARAALTAAATRGPPPPAAEV